jgi:hypothetical protein
MPTVKKNTELLIEAVKRGDAVGVQGLIPLSNPKKHDSYALRLAAINGHTQCVKLLIPVSNPKSNQNYALQMAAQRGHLQCVELLIPVSDAKANDSAALQYAAYNGHHECVEVLYPVSNPVVALQKLQHEHPDDYNVWGQLYEMVQAERVRNTLSTEVGTTHAVKVQRKM